MTLRSPFEDFLAERIGLDPASIGAAAIDRAVQVRAARAAQGDVARYWDLLNRSPEERQALIEQVVVPETWFFRYPESLALLGERVAAMLAARDARASQAPVRIISVPCSTGEEPYSIVMALRDRGIGADRAVVHGLDVSHVAVQRARDGVYGKNAFRTEDLGFRTRYFSDTSQGFRLHAPVRAGVTFRVENLFDLSSETRATAYDIVFCRNLLIYFDPETQARALNVLASLTSESGELFVGPAEASLLTRSGYVSVGTHRAFAFRRADPQTLARRNVSISSAAAAPRNTTSAPSNSTVAPPNSTVAPPNAGAGARPAPLGLAQRSFSVPWRSSPTRSPSPDAARSSAAPQRSAASPQGSTSDATQPYAWIQALADQGHVKQAGDAAKAALTERGPDAELFYLLGLCLDAQNDLAAAAAHYRKALYLAPDHVHALNHLAALLDAQGEGDAAQRMRLRAMREEARRE